MKNHNFGKSRLFFIEFLIVLFFFLIISTVCLKLFASAHQITLRADALSHAQTAAVSVAESLKAIDTASKPDNKISEFLTAVFPEAEILSSPDDLSAGTAAAFRLTYDRNFAFCEPEQAYYTLDCELHTMDHEKEASIIIRDRKQNTVYELSVSFHEPLTRREVLS